MKTKIQEKFKAMFGDGASLFASPGRVNLIGEHTDYNLGFVLPGAIDKAIYVALKPNDGTVCRVYSLDYDEMVELDLHGENLRSSGLVTCTACARRWRSAGR